MAYPHSYELVKQTFKDGGCTLLVKKYKNSKALMPYICSCGNKSKTSFGNFIKGHRCRQCGFRSMADKRRFTFKYVKKQFADAGCKLLAKEYKNCVTKMPYVCSCGNKSEIIYGSFRNGNRCKRCGIKKQSEKKRPTLEYVKKKFKEGGCELLAKVYKNAHTKMPYICSCGNKSEITYVHFRNSRRCKKCAIKKVAGKQRHTFEYVKKQFADGGCTLIARDYKNAKTKMPYLCSCGNQSEISYNTFKKGGRCRKCGIKKGTRRGEDSSSWNPNLTDKEREGKRVSGNDTWSKNVKKRDSHTCQGCASTKNLHAHHIMSYKNHKELRIDISNGITLCHDCHMDFHRMYSRSGGTPKQLASFLKGEKKIN